MRPAIEKLAIRGQRAAGDRLSSLLAALRNVTPSRPVQPSDNRAPYLAVPTTRLSLELTLAT